MAELPPFRCPTREARPVRRRGLLSRAPAQRQQRAAKRANALIFLDQHGAEAYRLGWTAPQLFGVHPEHGFLRVEYAGALMVNDSPVVGVEPDRIVFDRFSGYRTQPGQTWGPSGLGNRGQGARLIPPVICEDVGGNCDVSRRRMLRQANP